ncbi:hypothetical protein ACLOJK_025361 [Asimina triloba]
MLEFSKKNRSDADSGATLYHSITQETSAKNVQYNENHVENATVKTGNEFGKESKLEIAAFTQTGHFASGTDPLPSEKCDEDSSGYASGLHTALENTVSGAVDVTGNRLCNAESETVERTADASEGVLRVQRSQRLLQKLGGGIRVNGTRSSTSELPRGGNSVTAAAALEKKLILVEIEAGGASFILKEIRQCLPG